MPVGLPASVAVIGSAQAGLRSDAKYTSGPRAVRVLVYQASVLEALRHDAAVRFDPEAVAATLEFCTYEIDVPIDWNCYGGTLLIKRDDVTSIPC